jgi:glycosyltransferase involved in cell wall biosynthesis
VGIVVPAFNSLWSIGDTIQSIRAQRLADFQCIVVDDGSTDDIRAAISAATNGDRRFEIVRQDNSGLAAARNRGLEGLRTPFAAFIDSDDLWHPDFLLRLVEALENAPHAPFAYAHSLRVDRFNKVIPTVRWPYVPRHDVEGLLSINTVASGSAAVFRTDVLRAAGAFDPSFRSMGAEGAEDWHLSLRLAAEAQPVLVPDYLAVYRLNENGMSQGDPARQLRAVRAVMDDIHRRYPELRDKHFRDARTASNGWILAAVLRRQGLRHATRLLAQSYVLNPLWFLNRDLRALHLMKIMTVVASRGPRRRLADIDDPDGTRPFAFLDEPMIDVSHSIDGAAAAARLNAKDR